MGMRVPPDCELYGMFKPAATLYDDMLWEIFVVQLLKCCDVVVHPRV